MHKLLPRQYNFCVPTSSETSTTGNWTLPQSAVTTPQQDHLASKRVFLPPFQEVWPTEWNCSRVKWAGPYIWSQAPFNNKQIMRIQGCGRHRPHPQRIEYWLYVQRSVPVSPEKGVKIPPPPPPPNWTHVSEYFKIKYTSKKPYLVGLAYCSSAGSQGLSQGCILHPREGQTNLYNSWILIRPKGKKVKVNPCIYGWTRKSTATTTW
jgi:hypothetical protein